MSATTRSLIRQPRPIEASWPTGLAFLAAVLFITGYVANPALPQWLNLGAGGLLGAASAWLGVRAWRAGAEAGWVAEAEQGLVWVVTTMVVVRTAAGYGLDLYPLVYLLLAFLVTFQSRRAGITAVVFALVLEAATHLMGTAVGGALTAGVDATLSPAGLDAAALDLATLGTRAAFIGLFGLLSFFIHGTEVLERRRRHRLEVAEQREQMLKQAREFRLLNSGRLEPAGGDGGQLAVFDAVEAVQHTVYVSLSLLKTALGCHTCVLLWFDVKGERLHIKELVSDADGLIEGAIEPERGVIGGITRRREPVRLSDIRPGFRGLSYYRQSPDVRHFMGVPVIEQGHLRGVLCVDRADGEPFDSAAVHVAEETADYILRAIENERLFTSIEKTKFELGRFFEASRRLNGVLTPEEVHTVALESIGGIVDYDFAAITHVDGDTGQHLVEVVDGPLAADDWKGMAFGDNQGLVAMAVKNQHYLPFGGHVRDNEPVVFTAAERIRPVRSMLVLPLIVHDEAIGTLVVACKAANQFSAERREMLEVISNQVAISLQNAQLYKRMEQMATTDGLTGLANHRSFQRRLEETIARHRRTKTPFGLILTDIDHFKSVNDTYGHPVGDEVLRQVAATFREQLREVDTPCRYGGEEFAIILEDTDRATALEVANRLRVAIGELVFDTDQGPFSCTISMGVSIWDEDAEHKQKLIDLTDQALYWSKEHGRDQVTSVHEL